jgi:hypothetical protein
MTTNTHDDDVSDIDPFDEEWCAMDDVPGTAYVAVAPAVVPVNSPRLFLSVSIITLLFAINIFRATSRVPRTISNGTVSRLERTFRRGGS